MTQTLLVTPPQFSNSVKVTPTTTICRPGPRTAQLTAIYTLRNYFSVQKRLIIFLNL